MHVHTPDGTNEQLRERKKVGQRMLCSRRKREKDVSCDSQVVKSLVRKQISIGSVAFFSELNIALQKLPFSWNELITNFRSVSQRRDTWNFHR